MIEPGTKVRIVATVGAIWEGDDRRVEEKYREGDEYTVHTIRPAIDSEGVTRPAAFFRESQIFGVPLEALEVIE
jgi:hypothetical protein